MRVPRAIAILVLLSSASAAWLPVAREPAAREDAEEPLPYSLELTGYENERPIEYIVVLDRNPLGIIGRRSTWGAWVSDAPLLRSIVTESDMNDLATAYGRTIPPFRDRQKKNIVLAIETVLDNGIRERRGGYSAEEATKALDAMMASSYGTTYDALAKLRTRILSTRP